MKTRIRALAMSIYALLVILALPHAAFGDESIASGIKEPEYDLDVLVKSAISGEDSKRGILTEDNTLYLNFRIEGGVEDEKYNLYSIPNITQVAYGRSETGVITTEGDLYVWVHPDEWSSTETYFPRDAPRQQVMPGTKFKLYTTSCSTSYAIDADGHLWAWGRATNSFGVEMDPEVEVDVSNPIQLLPQKRFKDMSAYSGNGASGNRIALATDGTVYAWGPDYEASLSDDKRAYLPTEVPLATTVVSVRVGQTHFGALDSSGGLYLWGGGGNGQLGVLDSSGEPYSSLQEPALALTNVAQFSLGDYYSAAVTKNGELYAFGWNQASESVYSSSADNIHKPTKVMDSVKMVSCGVNRTLAVKEDGSLWQWGDEFFYDENPPHLLIGSDKSATYLAGTVTATLRVTLDKENKHDTTHDFAWDDHWLLQDSSVYNSKLSIASMVLSWAAYDDTPKNNYRYITKTLKSLGMHDIQTSSYTNRIANEDSGYTSSIDRVAYSFSHRKTLDEEGNAVELVLVVVRGTPGNIEWNSNANVADGTNDGIDPMFHEGFKAAEREILFGLSAYLNEHNIDDATARILITGHSRGAAVANLLAADLQNQTATEYTQDIDKSQVYAYTFATPAGAIDPNAHSDAYNNIFNIVNPEDFVPRVPLSAWGFERYGKTFYLPSKSEEPFKFGANISKLQNRYYELCGMSYKPYESGAGAANGLVEDAVAIAGSKEAFYVNSTPQGLANALAKIEGNRWLTFRDFFGNLTTFLATGSVSAIGEDVLDSLTYGRYGEILLFFIANYRNECIAHAHTKETYLGWLEVLDEAGVPMLAYGSRSESGKLTTYCPVALTVYDAEGNWECSIRADGDIVSDDSCPIALMYDEATDGKSVWLPTNGAYTVNITPMDDGEMDVVWQEYDLEGAVRKTACFNNVALNFFDDYRFSVDETVAASSVVDAGQLTAPDGTHVTSDYVTDSADTSTQYQITVTADGSGEVSGACQATRGSHVAVAATPLDNYVFIGWYENGKQIEGAEQTYTFRVEGDRNLEARFALLPVEYIDMFEKLEIEVGSTENLYAETIPYNASNQAILYESSNPKVATVDADGNVKAVAPGTARITARVAKLPGGSEFVAETCVVTCVAKGQTGSGVTGDNGGGTGTQPKEKAPKVPAMKFKKVKAGKRTITLTWKKQASSKVTGYQIQYGLKKNFKKAKTVSKKVKVAKLAIKKLKSKKTYYVRIRAYKVVGGKRYYGLWSKAKRVVVK